MTSTPVCFWGNGCQGNCEGRRSTTGEIQSHRWMKHRGGSRLLWVCVCVRIMVLVHVIMFWGQFFGGLSVNLIHQQINSVMKSKERWEFILSDLNSEYFYPLLSTNYGKHYVRINTDLVTKKSLIKVEQESMGRKSRSFKTRGRSFGFSCWSHVVWCCSSSYSSGAYWTVIRLSSALIRFFSLCGAQTLIVLRQKMQLLWKSGFNGSQWSCQQVAILHFCMIS